MRNVSHSPVHRGKRLLALLLTPTTAAIPILNAHIRESRGPEDDVCPTPKSADNDLARRYDDASQYLRALAERGGAEETSSIGLPVPFVPNVGQWTDSSFMFNAQLGRFAEIAVDRGGWRLALAPGAFQDRMTSSSNKPSKGDERMMLRVRLEGATTSAPTAGPRLHGKHSYFLGNDPGRWRTDVPLYSGVTFEALGSMVSLSQKEQALQTEIEFHSLDELESLTFQVEGADDIEVMPDGTLCLHTPLGNLVQTAPVLKKQQGRTQSRQKEQMRRARYVKKGKSSFGLSGRGASGQLDINAGGLIFSTYLGGGHIDEIHALREHKPGIVTVCGITFETLLGETAFPTTPGVYQPSHNPFTLANGLNNWPVTHDQSDRDVDGFVSRMRIYPPAGHTGPWTAELMYSTFLGGKGNDYLEALWVGKKGLITVGGYAEHNPFEAMAPTHQYPLTADATQTSLHDTWGHSQLKLAFREGILTQLDPDLPSTAQLVFSTYYGGTYHDDIRAVRGHGPKKITFAGLTSSHDLPGVGTYSFDPLLGGDGQPKIVGGPDIVTIEYDAFVARIGPPGFGPPSSGGVIIVPPGEEPPPEVRWATYLGGGSVDGTLDAATALDVTDDIVTVVGRTDSIGFPTSSPTIQPYLASQNPIHWDGFMTQFRLDPDFMRLKFSTFLGGEIFDIVEDVVVQPESGYIYVTGATSSGHLGPYGWGGCSCNPDTIPFPTTPGAYDQYLGRTEFGTVPENCYGESMLDAFVSIIDPSDVNPHLVASTFLGGDLDDLGSSISLSDSGLVTVTGWTHCPSGQDGSYPGAFPWTENAYSNEMGGEHDGNGASLQSRCVEWPGSIAADAFVTCFDPDLSQLLYSSYFGAHQDEFARGISVSSDGKALIAGTTYSNEDGNLLWPGWTEATPLPTTPDAYSSNYSDSQNAFGMHWTVYVGNEGYNFGEGFMSVLDITPVGVLRFGESSPSNACKYSPVVGVTRVPAAGDPLFSLSCVDAPEASSGLLWISLTGPEDPPVDWNGVDQLVDNPSAIAVSTGNDGTVIVPFDLSGLNAGDKVWAQFVIALSNCPPIPYVASDAIEITVQ